MDLHFFKAKVTKRLTVKAFSRQDYKKTQEQQNRVYNANITSKKAELLEKRGNINYNTHLSQNIARKPVSMSAFHKD